MNKVVKAMLSSGGAIILAFSVNTLDARIIEKDIKQAMGEVYVAREDTVEGDVKLGMGEITIDGMVNGDVKCGMGNVIVNGTVNGNIKVGMGEIENKGVVTGNTYVDMGGVSRGEVEEEAVVSKVIDKEILEGIAFELPIVSIKVFGVNRIPEQTISDTMDIKIGDTLNIEELIKSKESIKGLGYFKTVDFNVQREGEGIGIGIKVEENPFVTEVSIKGNTVFSSDEIAQELKIATGEVLKGSIDEKKNIIERMYYNRGYTLAKVTPIYEEGILTFNIDEGRIDKIEITGNKRIPTKAILEIIDTKEGDLYNEKKINEAIERLEEKYPIEETTIETPVKTEKHKTVSFGSKGMVEMKDIETTEIQPTIAEEEGKNVLRISICEKSLLTFDAELGYNRVEGLRLPFTLSTRLFSPEDLKVKIMCGYAFAPKLWQYSAGVEKLFFYPHSFGIGAEYRNIVDTQDEWILSKREEMASSFFLNRDYWDYYIREGWGVWVTQVIIPGHGIKVEYNAEENNSIEAKDIWSVFNTYKPWRENPPIDEGEIRSVTASYTCDIQNKTHDIKSDISIEKAGSERLGGIFDFTRVLADIRSYNKLSSSHFLDFRIRVGYSNDILPIQKRFYLGGVSSLRGCNYKEFSGNIMVLGNIEYRFGNGTPQLVLLFDNGATWERKEDIDLREDLKPSVGIGVQNYEGNVSLSIHRRMDTKDAPLRAYLRLSKTF